MTTKGIPIMTTNPFPNYDLYDNDQLLQMWSIAEEWEGVYRKDRQRIEFELQTRMKADRATAIPHKDLTCELVNPTPKYDYSKLRGLAELVRPEELAKGFTPAHEETVLVPDAWNMTKIKPLMKYGEAVRLVIEGAVLPAEPQLRIKRKAQSP